MSGFVLYEDLASDRFGKPLWFKQMTGIGPMSTPNKDDRRVFATEEEANRCPALWHPLSFYEVHPA